jgi:single-stranded-DNA-specific exonuclease
VEELMTQLRLPRAVCSVLAARGLGETEDAKRFLRPRLEHLHDPEQFADGPRAADRIVQALRDGETILVHGDYDVDGICATTILTRWLRRLGGKVTPFVPHRLRDGYDFTSSGLDAARQAGATLVVTVDCGSVAHEAVRDARSGGIDVIVTDHHTVAESLPDAYAVVNPKRPDCLYPDKELAGSGIAWKLAQLVGSRVASEPEALNSLLDLVALATIADLVPLTGENRVLAHYGLKRLASAPGVGLHALLRVADFDPGDVTAGRVGYQIAPRINAAGRIGEAGDALQLLLTDDEAQARDLARRLDDLNRERRDEDARTVDEALAQLADSFDPMEHFGLVIAGEGWHPGVIGIVASRVAERVHRPVVMLALDGDRARGSARSIPGFHLYDALSACSGHLERFGGHKQAAGMDLRASEIPAFRDAFNDESRTRLTQDLLRPVLRPDIDVSMEEADLQLAHWLGYLGPHGMGNPGPLLRARAVGVEEPKIVGSGHLKARLRQGRQALDAIGFGLGERFSPATVRSGSWDALFRLEKNSWKGRERPQARLVDLRPSGADEDS